MQEDQKNTLYDWCKTYDMELNAKKVTHNRNGEMRSKLIYRIQRETIEKKEKKKDWE